MFDSPKMEEIDDPGWATVALAIVAGIAVMFVLFCVIVLYNTIDDSNPGFTPGAVPGPPPNRAESVREAQKVCEDTRNGHYTIAADQFIIKLDSGQNFGCVVR